MHNFLNYFLLLAHRLSCFERQKQLGRITRSSVPLIVICTNSSYCFCSFLDRGSALLTSNDRMMDQARMQTPQSPDVSSSPNDVTFTVDLVSAAVDELSFLAAVDSHRPPLDVDGPALRRAVRRYERCWMPLIADLIRGGNDVERRCAPCAGSSGGGDNTAGGRQQLSASLTTAAASATDDGLFAPPLDVHWVWHCHMLSPYAYQSDSIKMTAVDASQIDCRRDGVRVAGFVVNHRVRSSDELRAARDRTRPLWNAAFPDEPFDVSDRRQQPQQHQRQQPMAAQKQGGRVESTSERTGSSSNEDSSVESDHKDRYTSKCTYDLVAAVLRQSKFYYQVQT